MIKRTLAQIARMAGGTLNAAADPNADAAGVSTDTRTIEAGNLFVPLVGRNMDAHEKVEEAIGKGAAVSFWQQDRPNAPDHLPLIYVERTLEALQRLAAGYRSELPAKVVGITGSNGKTTTKDMVYAVLSAAYRVHKTQGNLNSHEGLPLTLLRTPEDAQWIVLEMGMRGRGEIELLTRIATPDVAVITMIGEAHLERLGSRLEIARAKAEILLGLQDGGTFVYPGEEPLLARVLPEMKLPDNMKRISFGLSDDNELVPDQVRLTGDGTSFAVKGSDTGFTIPLLGRHNVTNALAAIAVGRAAGIGDSVIASGLAGLEMTSLRIEVQRTPSGLTLLNDTWNASPTSTQASVALLGELTGYSRKFAVLGDMLELGPQEEEFHREIGRMLQPDDVQFVYAYGRLAKFIAEEAMPKYASGAVKLFEDKAELTRAIAQEAQAEDVVLLKGSRGMQLDQVAAQLMLQ